MGPPAPHAAAGARPRRHQAAALRRARRPAVSSGPRSSRSSPPARSIASSISRRSITTCPFSTRRAIARSSRACASCRRATSSAGATAGPTSSSTGRSAPPSRSAAARTTPPTALRGVLADAVRSHMVSDVPLGAFLSGGVDSSIVVGLMAEASSRPVKTFSIGFDEPQFDELEHARTVARHFGTEHHEFVVRPDGLSILDRLVGSLRRAVRGFLGDPDLVRLRDCPPARHRRAVRRRRRRAVRRIRPVPAASARGAVRPAGRSPAPAGSPARCWPLLPHGARGKNFLRHVSRTDDGRYLDSVAFFQPDEKDALYSAGVRARARAMERRGRRWAASSRGSRRCRRTAG